MRDLQGANVLVLGMAGSGHAAVRLLAEKGARPAACDRKPLEEFPGLAEELEALRAPFVRQAPEAFSGRDLIVLSPGVPADLPDLEAARARGVPVLGEVELAGWFLQGPVIGTTGSNGKTTTVSLIQKMLEAGGIPCLLGGNIGRPVCAMVAESRPGQWNNLELSSFQLETIQTFSPQIGLALNLTDNHLDRHKTMKRYTEAKSKLFTQQTAEAAAVLNAANPHTASFAELTPAEVIWFSAAGPLAQGAWLRGEELVLDGDPILEMREVKLRGRHNAGNVLAAAAAARRAGADLGSIREAALAFGGIEHRLEYVATIGGAEYFNDSKATTVASSIAAIESFPGGLWVILGGQDKGSDFAPLRAPLAARAKGVLLIGKAAGLIEEHLGAGLPLEPCGTLERALRSAARQALPGDTVLLAPACASFDQFSSYGHRGQVFKEIVRQIQQERERA
jgi:UDP-N-acetylmuramoylalanine--D-glutamate ligase